MPRRCPVLPDGVTASVLAAKLSSARIVTVARAEGLAHLEGLLAPSTNVRPELSGRRGAGNGHHERQGDRAAALDAAARGRTDHAAQGCRGPRADVAPRTAPIRGLQSLGSRRPDLAPARRKEQPGGARRAVRPVAGHRASAVRGLRTTLAHEKLAELHGLAPSIEPATASLSSAVQCTT